MKYALTHSYPREIKVAGRNIVVRPITANDEGTILTFARALPPHDLLFMRRRITEPKVVSAWVREADAGNFPTLIAIEGGSIVGCVAILRDPLSWSPHVAELRLVVAPGMRGNGLGRALTEEAFAVALDAGIEKIMAYMTVDQRAAIAVFEDVGFKAEAVFHEHVKDLQDHTHDVAVLSLNLVNYVDRMQTFGVAEPT
jgi:L-amino acid N-acyltransferase YncA